MNYRKEIDGLRTIAVLPVILFHAGFEHFSGGFVGVDVFFVISGYLITTIILSEIEKGKFSLVTFYERRARRIVPALFIVMFVSIFFSWFWLTPSHMKDFSESLVAVCLFASNILFWQETGYWGVENELKPLLHTWSLAVEEQYYVLFPLFLLAMWRFNKWWILSSFIVIAITSLILSHWAAYNLPTANFFLLPMRGWELAIGAGIAFYFLYRKPVISNLLSNKTIDDLLSWLGLGLIALAVFSFDERTPFPSLYALVPTVGTALIIIFSSKDTSCGRLLGAKPLVSIGLISYSAYLWHQPLFVFARHRSLEEPSLLMFASLSVLSLILAFLSFKYIEAPFRNRKTFSRNQIFSITAIGSLIFITFGIVGHLSEGYAFRFDQKLAEGINLAEKKSFSSNLCLDYKQLGTDDNEYCVLVPNQQKFAILYGDSHAQALMNEAQKVFKTTDYGLLYAATSACPPIKSVYRADHANISSCYEQNNKVYKDIVANPLVEYVVLSSRWTLGIEGERFDNKEGGVESGTKPQLDIVDNEKYLLHEDYGHRELLANAYKKSIQHFINKGKKVILIYPVPEAGWNVPTYIGKFYMINPESVFDNYTGSTSYDVFRSRNERTISALDKIERSENLHRIYPEHIFCNTEIEGRCITHLNGLIYYSDDDHLSDAGAKLVMEQVVSQLK
jgi:peptidoglycan/LPS O-acetylase OafA/YrhL